jgi:NADH dehydrogenase FAD-containing subunit
MAALTPPPAPPLQVTFIEAMPNIMPGFDKEIARMAQRLLIQGRPIDFQTNVLATKVTPGVPGQWLERAAAAGATCQWTARRAWYLPEATAELISQWDQAAQHGL